MCLPVENTGNHGSKGDFVMGFLLEARVGRLGSPAMLDLGQGDGFSESTSLCR